MTLATLRRGCAVRLWQAGPRGRRACHSRLGRHARLCCRAGGGRGGARSSCRPGPSPAGSTRRCRCWARCCGIWPKRRKRRLIVVHLDHGYSGRRVRALRSKSGFTSVMYRRLAKAARRRTSTRRPPSCRDGAMEQASAARARSGSSVMTACEAQSAGTDPDRGRATFARETGIDAMAISVGNVHLQTGPVRWS